MEVNVPIEDSQNESMLPRGLSTPPSKSPEHTGTNAAPVGIQDLDWTYLQEVSDGDQEFFAHTLTQLQAQILEFLQRLQKALAEDNNLEMRSAIHRIQPSFAMIGQGRLIALLKEISLLLKSGGKSCLDLTPEMARVVATSREILDRVERYHRDCCG